MASYAGDMLAFSPPLIIGGAQIDALFRSAAAGS